jgi:hypothetical protein
MATLATYQGWVTKYLNTEAVATNDMFDSTNVTAAINAARYEFARRVGFNTDFCRDSGTTVTATTTAITLPADYLGNLRVRFGATANARRYLQPITFARLDEMNPNWRDETTTEPRYYVVSVNADGTTTFTIVPTLSASVASGAFYTYTEKPTALSLAADTATEMTFFPDIDMLAIPSRAISILANFENGTRDDLVAKYDAIFEQQIINARRTLNSMASGRPSWNR